MILKCEDCNRATTLIEATYRMFWTGLCGNCGGTLRDVHMPSGDEGLERRSPQ